MELVIPLIVSMFLGMMPVVMYYFGWLAGRPRHAPVQRLAFRAYVVFLIVMLGLSVAGLLLMARGDESLSWWLYILPTGLLLVIAPTLAIWFFFAASSRRLGRCAVCDYDLRGNITGRCPECGAKFEYEKSNHG